MDRIRSAKYVFFVVLFVLFLIKRTTSSYLLKRLRCVTQHFSKDFCTVYYVFHTTSKICQIKHHTTLFESSVILKFIVVIITEIAPQSSYEEKQMFVMLVEFMVVSFFFLHMRKRKPYHMTLFEISTSKFKRLLTVRGFDDRD